MNRDQSWFEMQDVKTGILGDGEWTPLWVYDVVETGDSMSSPYCQEIYRVRSLFSPVSNKRELLSTWRDLDTDNCSVCVDNGHYCKASSYYADSRNEPETGEYVVYRYRLVAGETSELCIAQDLTSALALIRKGDSWMRPSERDVEVIRICRDATGCEVAVEIRTEYLKDYLCARSMGLYIEVFRHREEHNTDVAKIKWNTSPIEEYNVMGNGNGRYVWKGWMFKHINEYSWIDVASIGDETLSLPQFYRVEGQLWKQLWVEPGVRSERIAGDSPKLEFIVSPNGDKHEISAVDDSAYGHVYLAFRSDLVKRVYGAGFKLSWSARDVFSAKAPGGEEVKFGITKRGDFFCLSADVARLDSWAQYLFHADNIRPEDAETYYGTELFQNQKGCQFLHTKAPETEFIRLHKALDEAFKSKAGVHFWKQIDTISEVLAYVSRFNSMDQDGYVLLAKRLTIALIELVNVHELKMLVSERINTKDIKSIDLLSLVLPVVKSNLNGEALVAFMRNINKIRQADAHLMSASDKDKRLGVIAFSSDSPWIERGAQLIEYANTGLKNLIDALK